MTEISSNSFSPNTNSISDNQTTDEIFEIIGQKVLSSWDFNYDLSKSIIESDPLEQINHILSLPPERLPLDWDNRIRALLEKLSPADFAVYGKQICLNLLNIKANASRKSMTPARHLSSKSSPTIKTNEKVPSSERKSSRKSYYYSPMRSSRSSLRSAKKIAHDSMKNKPTNDPLYTEFPPWLPTITE